MMNKQNLPKILPVFPLSNFIIFPETTVPLNIFETRYVEMINDSMKTNKMIGLIQPKSNDDSSIPGLHKIGCLGKIISFKETDDGKYLIDVIVDLESNRDIGYCLSSVTKDSIGEVDSLYVKEEYRDAHMGTILMQRAMDFFEMHHTIKDVLHVSEGNEHALSFYEKYGFQTRYYQLVREK